VSTPIPPLSVLVPNFNHSRFLRDSLPAILRNKELPTEVVVIDDASTDDSWSILEEIRRSDQRVEIHRNSENLGVVATVGRLLQLAKADYVYFAAADDLVLPGFFARSMAILANNPEAGMCSTLTRMIDAEGHDLGRLPAPFISREAVYLPPARVRELLVSVGAWFQGNTVVMRRHALIEAGGYHPELESFTDSFAAHVVALRNGACFIPEPLAAWRILPDTYSRRVLVATAHRTELLARAVAFMEGPYRSDFPRGYARQWRRELEFTLARAAAADLRARHARTVERWLEGVGIHAAALGAFAASMEWLVRMLLLVPALPPHVLRRYLRRRGV
jgi:glycosyltransferase involved in cell wall biosynthesis